MVAIVPGTTPLVLDTKGLLWRLTDEGKPLYDRRRDDLCSLVAMLLATYPRVDL